MRAEPIHYPDYGSAKIYIIHTFHICINTMNNCKMTLICMNVPCILQASVLTFDITNIVSCMWYKTNVSLDLCA